MSGRACSSCSDPRRPEIDAAIVAGKSFRVIARQFAPLSHDAIRRHRPHVARALVKTEEARRGAEDETLLDKVKALEADAHRLKRKAEDGDDVRAALVAIDKLLEIVRLYGDLMPAPKPSPADVERTFKWYAEDIGISVDELKASCEEHARIADEIRAGGWPAHRERPAPPPPYRASVLPAETKPDEAAPAPAPPPPAPPFRASV
jgi:hypothetical protein